MVMKTIVSTLLLLVITSGVYAQEAKKVTYADKKQVEDFFKSKTMIVLDANPLIGYNIVVTDAVKKYWTVTPYEIITSDQFDKMRTDPKLSFIFLSKVQLEKDEEEVYYLYMNVVMGAKTKDLTDMPELLSLPLAYTGVDEDNYVDKLPLMVRFAQIHLNNLKTAKNPKSFYNLKKYSDDSKELKNKTLLVKESDLSEEVNTLEKIQKEYPGPVKIVTSEEMVKAVEEQAPGIAVLHQIGPGEDENKGRSYREIFGADDAKLYYYNYQTISQRRPVGMLARDFHLILGKWF
jgi:hypothetical protein